MSAERQITFVNTYKVVGSETDKYFNQLPQHDLSALYTLLDRNYSVLRVKNAVDIGANIGLASLCIFDRHPNANIFAFEPSPENIKYLIENIRMNGRTRGFQLTEAAVGERREKLWFQFNPDFCAGSRIVREPGGSYEVEVVPLDYQLSDRKERIDLIKIDVEGHEIPVLRGAKKILTEDNPVVLFECNPYAIKASNAVLSEFLAAAMELLGPLGRVDAASGRVMPLPLAPMEAEAALMKMLENEFSVFDLVTLRSRFNICAADSTFSDAVKATDPLGSSSAESLERDQELAQTREQLRIARSNLEQALSEVSLQKRRADEADARVLADRVNRDRILDGLLNAQRDMFEKMRSDESEIRRLRDLIAKRERRIGEMHLLRASDAKLARLNATAAATKEAQLAAERDVAFEERDAAKIQLHEAVNSLSRSWSWRLMQPLRWFGLDKSQRNIILSVAADQNARQALTGSSPGSARIENLLVMDGPAFIDAAYRMILNRRADPDGASHLLSILNMGEAKIQILARMMMSPEGARVNARVHGFAWRYWVYRLSTRPVIGGLTRLILGTASPMSSATHGLENLLKLDGRAFVEEAYRKILHRSADQEGLNSYLASMQKGVSKVRVISALQNSGEGRKAGARLRGLFVAQIIDTIYRIPLIGRILWAWVRSGDDSEEQRPLNDKKVLG